VWDVVYSVRILSAASVNAVFPRSSCLWLKLRLHKNRLYRLTHLPKSTSFTHDCNQLLSCIFTPGNSGIWRCRRYITQYTTRTARIAHTHHILHTVHIQLMVVRNTIVRPLITALYRILITIVLIVLIVAVVCIVVVV